MKSIALAFLAYLVLFVVWRHLQPSGIVFYQGVILALAVSGSQILLVRITGRQSWAWILKDALLSFLLSYCLVFTVPTTVDRAYSVRMILEIEKDSRGLTRDQIEHWFATDFGAQGGVEKRIHEQMATGSILLQDGRYTLTPLGNGLAAAFRVTQAVFATKPLTR